MPLTLTRRAALAGAALSLPWIGARAERKSAEAQLIALEKQHGGRFGVFVRDTGNGREIAHRADGRFPMCSTFKLLLAAAVLKRVDEGKLRLDQMITYGARDLLSYAPVTKTHVGDGRMSLAALCAAAIELSDNTAANLMLRETGGPAGWTAYARALGDKTSRLDRTEPTLNTAIPNDPRDTTTPRAMAADLQAVLVGEALSPSSRRQLEAWMVDAKTGAKRLRAGLPGDWRVGDKTGTGDNGTANTIAIIRPPQRAPLLATVYYTGSRAPAAVQDDVHAAVGRLIGETF